MARPTIKVDAKKRVTPESARALVDEVSWELQQVLGTALEDTARHIKREGYAEVAFVVHFPFASGSREFAYPVPLADVDLAFVFEEPLDFLGTVTAHEELHLFGADDLYPLDVYDPGDADDVMRAACRGFSAMNVGDMTAYAIGWRPTPPARGYLR
jgi:hypothetical protein